MLQRIPPRPNQIQSSEIMRVANKLYGMCAFTRGFGLCGSGSGWREERRPPVDKAVGAMQRCSAAGTIDAAPSLQIEC